jgi:predicted AAA+ superfamily ATPase
MYYYGINKMHIVILNGPRNTGKDTLGNLLLELYPGSIHVRFKDVLYTSSYENWRIERRDISLEQWIELCNDPVLKEVPVEWLGNSKENA